MKKIIFLSLVMVLLTTGCGAGATETLSCEYNNTSGALTTKIVYNIDHEADEVKKVRITYDYHQDNLGTNGGNIDGVGTGTDGTTNDTQLDNDGIIDGIVGSAIDGIISGVADTILDVSGLRNRHASVQSIYGNMTGFSVQNTNDETDNDYKVTYIIDYDMISDDDLGTLNLSRDIDTLRSNYISRGFTCHD